MKTYKTERQKLVEQYQNLQTNDELLAAQAQYYKQKNQKESKFKRSKKEENKQNETKSKFKQNRDTLQPDNNNKAPKVQFKQSTLVVKDILEKNTANIGSQKDRNAPFIMTEKGFPAVIKHNAEEIANDVKLHQHDSMWDHQQFFNTKKQPNTDNAPAKKQPKLSLFAQRMKSKDVQSNKASETLNHQQMNTTNNDASHPLSNVIRSLKMPHAATKDKNTLNSTDSVSFIKKINMECNIVTDDEISKIGSENDTFLRQHDESELLEMRQELLSSLNPQLIALLTGKKAEEPLKKEANKKKPKLKISYQDAENQEETKSADASQSKPKSSVIRKLKPLKSKKKTASSVNIHKNKAKASASQWVHPAKEIRQSFDASVDLNNDVPGHTQKEKMQWMEPLNVEQEEKKYAKTDGEPMMLGDNPLAYYRFGFDGEVLCDNRGNIKRDKDEHGNDLMHLGLHHHGEEPLKPGYTVNELIHLCKSSAPNQRNTAIKTLMRCIQKMRCGEYGMDYSEYLWILLQQNNLVSLIVDILSLEKNVSCIMPILDLLHAVIAPMRTLFGKINTAYTTEDIYTTCGAETFYNAQTERLVMDGIHILCNTLPNIAPEGMNTNQTLFIHDDKKGQYEKGSFKKKKEEKKNAMDDIWKCDVILALVRKTKLVRYLNGILSKYIVPNMDANDTTYVKNILPTLLDIIMTLIRHHPQITEMFLKTNGFIDNLLEIVFCRNYDQDQEYTLYKCKVLDIICIMCQMDKNIIVYLVSNDKLNELKTFIVEAIDNPNHSEKLQLSISTLQLWRVCIKFGYDFNAFNDLLPKLMHLLTPFIMKYDVKSTKKSSNHAVFALQQRQTRCFLNIIQILLQSLVPSNLSHLPSITTVSWNQIAKLTEKIISIFDDIFHNPEILDSHQITETDWLCIGGLCHVIATYFNTLKKQNNDTLGQPFNDILRVAQKQSMVLTKKYIATWCRTKENRLLSSLLLNKRNWTYNNTKAADKQDKKWIQFPFLDGLLADIPLSIAVVPNDEYLSKCDCLLSIIRMVRSFIGINKSIISILIDSQFIDAIARILLQITSKHFHFRLNRSLRGLLFDYWRIEFLLAFEILMLCNVCSPDLSDMKTLNITNFHSAACVLLECLPPGYMHYGDVLLNKFILNHKYLVLLKKLAVKGLKKTDSNKQLIALYNDGPDLNSLKDIYRKEDKFLPNVFNPNIIRLCDRTHSCSNTARIQSLCAMPSMVPTFWMLQPLVNLYKHNIASHSITTLLHFFLIVSRSYCDDFMDVIVTISEEDDDDAEDEDIKYKSHHYWCNIAVWDTYRSVTTLYLCDSDIYCDELNRLLIYELVTQCWNRIYFAQHRTDSCDIYLCDKNDPSSACMIDKELNEISEMNIKSLSREWEGFYTRLVEQFESDSFGDDLFAKIVLFQQQNKYKKQFRRLVWANMDSLCVLLKNQYPPNIYAWKSFFIPFESDDVMIDLQFQAIQKNKFNNLSNYRKQSFFYFVAVVQISHYIWNCKRNKKGYSEMLGNVLKQCDKSVIVDIVNCNFKAMESLQISHLCDTSKAVDELKQHISLGKENIITQANCKYIQDRISILKNDFFSICKTLSLL